MVGSTVVSGELGDGIYGGKTSGASSASVRGCIRGDWSGGDTCNGVMGRLSLCVGLADCVTDDSVMDDTVEGDVCGEYEGRLSMLCVASLSGTGFRKSSSSKPSNDVNRSCERTSSSFGVVDNRVGC
jgi:hypothetical protein